MKNCYKELEEYQQKINRERFVFWSEVLRKQRDMLWDDAWFRRQKILKLLGKEEC